jgi:hypothetical protein
MNFYILLVIFQISTLTDGFYHQPLPIGYEWYPTIYTDYATCKIAADALAAQKNSSVPFTAPPMNKTTSYVSACVQT